MKDKHEGDWGLLVLLTIFIVIASVYNVITPPFEMGDELWHYPVVRHIADGNGLPFVDPSNVGPWRQEGTQAPLYYIMAAAATFWIDTSDFDQIRRLNPHVDIGVITEDHNRNMIVHDFNREAWPWKGTTLAIHIIRFLSTLLSAGTLSFIYLITREIFPKKKLLPLASAGFAGFTPMYTFISGAVNNDNLGILISTAALWQMIRLVKAVDLGESTLMKSVWLGVTLGLGAISKVSTLGFIGLAGITLLYCAIKQKRWQTFFIEGPLIISLILAIAGWWYIRNYNLYGDFLANNAHTAVLGVRASEATLAQLWSERQGFLMSYWGLFGGVNIPLPHWIYEILNTILVIGILGSTLFIALSVKRKMMTSSQVMVLSLLFLAIAAVFIPLATIWARITWSSQGRLVFNAIGAISILTILGITVWLPDHIAAKVASVISLSMMVLSVISPFLWISPEYHYPISATESSVQPLHILSDPDSGEPIFALINTEVHQVEAFPGDMINVHLEWQCLQQPARDWSLFIHFTDSVGLFAGQRDIYPGNGRLATSDMTAGMVWSDDLSIPIARSAYAPETLAVLAGFYDFSTCPNCQRMTDSNGRTDIELSQIFLENMPGFEGVPNPIEFSFADEMALVGYEVNPRTAQAGDIIDVRLYWETLSTMTTDYTISTQIISPDTTRYAQDDSQPIDGSHPTSQWTINEVIVDDYRLTLDPATPPGLYWLQIVVYWQGDDGVLHRLNRITAEGRITDDFLLLTQIRVH